MVQNFTNKILIFTLAPILAGIILTGFLVYKRISNLQDEVYELTKSNTRYKAENRTLSTLLSNYKHKLNRCNLQLKRKSKDLDKLNKICKFKPKDIKPKIIYKKECKIKVESGDKLREKDVIYDTISNIGF